MASKAWTLARKGHFTATPELLSLAGWGADEMTDILIGLGYRPQADKDGVLRFHHRYMAHGKNKGKNNANTKGQGQGWGKTKVKPTAGKRRPSKESPFAKLRDLTVAPGR